MIVNDADIEFQNDFRIFAFYQGQTGLDLAFLPYYFFWL